VTQESKRPGGSDDCLECNRLWEHFAAASAELVQLVEEKYSTDKRPHALLDQSMRQAIEKRQHAKQRILAHERDKHAKGGDCLVCGGTGKVRHATPGAAEYSICSHCQGSGITRHEITSAE
jgi:hypothetical protein